VYATFLLKTYTPTYRGQKGRAIFDPAFDLGKFVSVLIKRSGHLKQEIAHHSEI
jgi:hypothetical protein